MALAGAGLLSPLAPWSQSVAESAPAFVPGSGTATAQALSFGFVSGGLSYGTTLGAVEAKYEVTEARASSQTLAPGVVGFVISHNPCTGSQPLFQPDQIPQPLEADSRNGPAQKSRSTSDFLGLGGAGMESVSANPAPAATAQAQGMQATVAGLLGFSGLSSQSASQLQPASRVATAASDVGSVSILGGLVQLQRLHWEAEQRTGGGATASGKYTVGALLVAGVPLDTSTATSLAAGLAQANSLLATAGLQLHQPQEVKRTDGSVEITPMVLSISGGALTSPLVVAAVGGLQPAHDQLTALLFGGSCDNRYYAGAAVTQVDVMLAALDGAGAFNVALGGAHAGTDDRDFANPFGAGGPPPPVSQALGSTITSDTAGTAPAPTPAPQAAARPKPAATTTKTCRTEHPTASSPCWSGLGTLAGGASLGLALGLLVIDVLWSSRRRREGLGPAAAA